MTSFLSHYLILISMHQIFDFPVIGSDTSTSLKPYFQLQN